MKYLPLLLLFFAFNATGQSFIDKDDAIRQIDKIIRHSPTPHQFEMNIVGIVGIRSVMDKTLIYTFDIKDIKSVEYENGLLYLHRIKFTCRNEKKCIFCDKNPGDGVFHYLEVNSREEASTIVSAFNFLMRI